MPSPKVTSKSLDDLALDAAKFAADGNQEKFYNTMKVMTLMHADQKHSETRQSSNDVAVEGKNNLVGKPALSNAMTYVLGKIQGKVETVIPDQESRLEAGTERAQALQKFDSTLQHFNDNKAHIVMRMTRENADKKEDDLEDAAEKKLPIRPTPNR
jgi:hypothetical protein